MTSTIAIPAASPKDTIDMIAFGPVRTWTFKRRRPPRSRYFHLTTEQLNRLSKVVDNGRPSEVTKAANSVGLTRTQLKEAVRRWRDDQQPIPWVKVTGGGGGGGGVLRTNPIPVSELRAQLIGGQS